MSDLGDEHEPLEPGVVLKGGGATLREYAGKVVAIVDGEVRAAGDSWDACFDAAERAQLDDPLMMVLPRGALRLRGC